MNLIFNPSSPRFMHIDLNSCFASIEQQANPFLRGKPIAVAAYTSPGGCILAASREAKKLGIKTGMRVYEGTKIYPRLIVMASDPVKYRFISHQLLALFEKYTNNVEMKSIDEALLDFADLPDLQTKLPEVAKEIKRKIKQEIGDFLTVSIGISTNSYLAKLAAGLQKPDGLVQIDKNNIEDVLGKLELENLPYIKRGNRVRLNSQGIYTPLDFLRAGERSLRAAFESVVGSRWHYWINGYEIPGVTFGGRFPGEIDKTIGHSYALTRPSSDDAYLASLLCQLVEKMGRRLRAKNFVASGMHVSCNLEGHQYWHHGQKLHTQLYEDQELFRAAWTILNQRPGGVGVTILAVNTFDLEPANVVQTSFFSDTYAQRKLALAVDTINDRWGDRSVTSALTLETKGKILDRVAFGKINGSPV